MLDSWAHREYLQRRRRRGVFLRLVTRSPRTGRDMGISVDLGEGDVPTSASCRVGAHHAVYPFDLIAGKRTAHLGGGSYVDYIEMEKDGFFHHETAPAHGGARLFAGVSLTCAAATASTSWRFATPRVSSTHLVNAHQPDDEIIVRATLAYRGIRP